MTQEEYLENVLCLFDEKRQTKVLELAKIYNNNINTLILAYVFYEYNFFPYCVEKCLDGNRIKDVFETLITSLCQETIPKSDSVQVSSECCEFLDKVILFCANHLNNPKLSESGKRDTYCEYMAYLLLTHKSWYSYSLFYHCLSSRDVEYATYTLKQSLLSVFNIPTDSNLLKYGRFLTDPLANNSFSCIGREQELQDLSDILSRKKKNNALLVGQPGVGKTAIVEGFAQLLLSPNCPQQFIGYHIYEASISSMLSGAKYRGDFEERLEAVLNSITQCSSPIILFIDEVHTIMMNNTDSGASTAGMSASDILKPYMGRAGLLFIGATTEKEYHQIEKDPAMFRRFSVLRVKEPNSDVVNNMVTHLIPDYENHFEISINNSLVPYIVKYAQDYIPNKYMPDKVLDLLDESCVYCKNHRQSKQLSLSDIINATEVLTGVQIPIIGEQSTHKINHIIQHLKSTIVGQDDAINALSSVVKRYFLGLCPVTKPIGSFLFVGPTGVGKTQLCKELAQSMFTRESFIRLDMSEFMEAHSVAKLIGSPPGYVGYGTGGVLTDAVKNNPYSVVLFDEIEKAHPDVFNILLQVLDDGCLTDSEGFTVNFSNCIIILTSNIGAKDVSYENSKGILGFSSKDSVSKDTQPIYENSVKKYFSPEFLNRLNGVVYFNSLTAENIKELVDRDLHSLQKQFLNIGVELVLTSKALSYLYDVSYSSEYGARYAQRSLVTHIEVLVVDYIIENALQVSEGNNTCLVIDELDGSFLCRQKNLCPQN